MYDKAAKFWQTMQECFEHALETVQGTWTGGSHSASPPPQVHEWNAWCVAQAWTAGWRPGTRWPSPLYPVPCTTGMDGWVAPKHAMAQFWGAHQRFFKQLCMAVKVPTVVEQAQAARAAGKCVVIGERRWLLLYVPRPCTLYPVPCTLVIGERRWLLLTSFDPVPCTLYPVPSSSVGGFGSSSRPSTLYPVPCTLYRRHR